MLAENIMKWKSIFNGNARTKENNKWVCPPGFSNRTRKIIIAVVPSIHILEHGFPSKQRESYSEY
jgi:hypothetical protein